MIFTLLYSFLISLLLGFGIVSLFWDKETPLNENLYFKLFLGFGVGTAATSLLFFCLVLFLNFNFTIYSIIEALTTLGLCIYLLKTRKINKNIIPSGEKLNLYIKIFFIFVLIGAIADFTAFSIINPYGKWDAVLIWNSHAEFLYKANLHWLSILTPAHPLTHTDYPLLIPASVARIWKYLGYDSVLAPILLGFGFVISTVGTLISGLSYFKTKNTAFLFGMILLATTFFIRHGASQYADIPLGYYFLATSISLSLYNKTEKFNFIMLSGLFSAFAIWCKNDGILFLGIILLSILIFQKHKLIKQYLIGILPVFLLWLLFKFQVKSSNDLLEKQTLQALISKICDISRYLTISKDFLAKSFTFCDGIVNFYFVLIILLISSIKKEIITNKNTLQLLFILTGMLLGYFMIYLITPHPLIWHLETSLKRLLIQLWPLFIFTSGLIFNDESKKA